MAECIDSFQFFENTKLGEELKKLIPPMTKRVIIDIRIDCFVTIYIECLPPKSMFNLNWPEVMDRIKIVQKADENNNCQSTIDNSKS